MKQAVFGLILLALGGPAPAEDIYEIDSRIHLGDELLATPGLIVQAGKRARVTIGDSLHYEVLLSESGPTTVALKTQIDIGGEAFRPAIEVALGELAKVRIGDMRLTVTVNRSDSR